MRRLAARWFHTAALYLMGPWGCALWLRRREVRRLRKRRKTRG